MMTVTEDDFGALRREVREVSTKMDELQRGANEDRKSLKRLHEDHVRLEGRVSHSERHLSKTQSDLDKHIEVACLIQARIRDDVRETKEAMKEHIQTEDADRREIIRHLKTMVERTKSEGRSTVMWVMGTGVTIVLALFSLLWATGAVGAS